MSFELDDSNVGHTDSIEVQQARLQELAEGIFELLSAQTGPRDTEATAALLENYAEQVRQGKI